MCLRGDVVSSGQVQHGELQVGGICGPRHTGRQLRLKTDWVEVGSIGSGSRLGMDSLSRLESLYCRIQDVCSFAGFRSSQGEELADRSGSMHSLLFLSSNENRVLLMVITVQPRGNGQLTLRRCPRGLTLCSFSIA